MADPVPVPTLDVLLPPGRGALPPDPVELALTALYAHPAPRPGWSTAVRASMVTTLDGAATGADRVSGSINDAADHRVFAVLRSVADVVLIGAGTARAEGYRHLSVAPALAPGRAARGQRDRLELAVVTVSGDLPAALLADDDAPLVITVAASPGLAALRDRLGPDRVIEAGTTEIDLPRALAALAARGLTRVLAEGGPHLLADLVAAGCVDELCLTTSPQLVGGSTLRILATDDWLDPARRLHAAHLLHSGGTLLARWVLDGGHRAPAARLPG